MCERFNCTLLHMLGTLEPEQKKNWKAYVGPLVHAYNCTQHDSTGFSQYYMMFGRNPRLPVDIVFGLRKEVKGSNYIKDLRDHLDHAYHLATEASKRSQQKQKCMACAYLVKWFVIIRMFCCPPLDGSKVR
jgi:hypothetical protein